MFVEQRRVTLYSLLRSKELYNNHMIHLHSKSNASANAAESGTTEEKLDQIIQQYQEIEETDTEKAGQQRLAFLQALRQEPELLQQADYSHFLASEVDPEDLAELEWESPYQMMLFSESLYQSRFDDQEIAERIDHHACLLLRYALYQYEKEGELEKMFKLLRLAPSSLLQQDRELSRMQARANAYEIRRVRHNRRFLYGYLIVQVVLVLFVFPYLFINAENGRLQNQVEQLADVELGDEGYQLITFSEGVYWSIITAGSIGYGDVTPTTTTGRVIAGTLGIMGVITVGILAGLVLDWITPRRIT